MSGSGRYGTYVLNRDASGVWQIQDYLRTVDGMYSGGNVWGASPEGNLVFRANYEEPYQSVVVNVFRLGSNGRYAHAAQIIPKAGENPNFGGFATSGRRLLIGNGGGTAR